MKTAITILFLLGLSILVAGGVLHQIFRGREDIGIK